MTETIKKQTASSFTVTNFRKPYFYAIDRLPTEPGQRISAEVIPIWSLEDAKKLQDENHLILKDIRIRTAYEIEEEK